MAIVPTPGACVACGTGGGGGGGGADVEQLVLCDVSPDGEILGTAVAVYEYDETGTPVGPPTFVNPVTGDPYVPQGVLQPCPAATTCGAPQQFCFVSSSTTDVPGRQYDLVLTLGQGFGVQGIIKDLVDTPVSIIWDINDPTGAQFATELQAAVQSQFPGQTVTVTPQGVDACEGTGDFAIHIECIRLDQEPPTLLQLRYNGGRDLIINPSFLTTPPVNTAAALQFVKRADSAQPGTAGDVNCTNIANRGWETNDKSSIFELWGKATDAQATFVGGVTPTPRGTQIQEINAFGSGPTPTVGPFAGQAQFGQNPDTIWQTFTVPAAGNFTVRVVVGGRTGTDAIPIKLSTGDVGDAGIGDIINVTVNAPKVTAPGIDGPGGPNPWTTFTQTVPLAPGTYTLAFTGPDAPVGGPGGANSAGGLFTDMRVFQDAPNTIDDFANDDDTCTVESTDSTTICEFWAPQCSNGRIAGWYNVATGEELSNADFWAQVPSPQCCTSEVASGGGGTAGNLVHTYLVCAQTETGQRTVSRVVITDPNGAVINESFVDTDGALISPSVWQPGQCGSDENCAPVIVGTGCYPNPNPELGPLRYTAVRNCDGSVNYYAGNGEDVTAIASVTTATCLDVTYWEEILCDADNGNAPFIRRYQTSEQGFANPNAAPDFTDFDLENVPLGVNVSNPVVCSASSDCLSPIGDICYTPPVAGPVFRNSLGSVQGAVEAPADTVTFTNWAGSGVDITVTGENLSILGDRLQLNNTGNDPITFTFSEPVFLNALTVGELDGVAQEQYGNFSPVFTGLTGSLFDAGGGTVRSNVNNGNPDGDILFGGALTDTLSFVSGNIGLGNWLMGLEFQKQAVNGDIAHAAVLRDCVTGELTYIDLFTGTEVDPDTVAFVQCVVEEEPVVETPDTLNAHNRLLAAGESWTPADVVGGTLTGLSFTVISGTATVTDSDGTVAAGLPAGLAGDWNAQDPNTLNPPQSILAVGGQTYLTWTVRS